MFDKPEETESKRHEMNPEFRLVALLFALSGIAPVVLLMLGLIGAEALLWVYIAVFGTVLSCRRIISK